MEEYPALPVKTDREIIQESICRIWGNLSRKNNGGLDSLNSELRELLIVLRDRRCDTGYMTYIELLFCMIAHTRDIAFGRGERDITYGMIYTWYCIFPVLAVYALEIIIQSSDKQNLAYGSWKDIARLCHYVRKETNNDQHPLILTAIEIANRQLKRDFHNNSAISNVSKWIPREGSKRDWLYDMFVKDFFPRMHRRGDSFETRLRTFSWHKAKYRKILSQLNSRNQTVEIKQCKNKWSNIDFFKSVSQCSLKKHWRAFMNQDLYGKNDIRHASLDRVECSQNTLHYLQVKLARDTHYCYETPGFFYGKGRGIPRSGFYTMHEFIKRAIYLREQRKLVEPFSLDFITNQYETYLLNTMWIQFSTRIGRPLGATIPILDVSLSMASSDEFYSAIGYAYLISEHSDINNRIIAFSHQTEWIVSGPIEPPETTGFVDDIYNIMKQLPGSTSKNFEGVTTLLQSAAFSSGYKLKDVNFVLISDKSVSQDVIPNMVHWNLSADYDHDSISFISGSSTTAFWQLCNLLSKNITQFELICKTINHLRYAPIRDCFKKLTAK
jgi:hypothetical protein